MIVLVLRAWWSPVIVAVFPAEGIAIVSGTA